MAFSYLSYCSRGLQDLKRWRAAGRGSGGCLPGRRGWLCVAADCQEGWVWPVWLAGRRLPVTDSARLHFPVSVSFASTLPQCQFYFPAIHSVEVLSPSTISTMGHPLWASTMGHPHSHQYPPTFRGIIAKGNWIPGSQRAKFKIPSQTRQPRWLIINISYITSSNICSPQFLASQEEYKVTYNTTALPHSWVISTYLYCRLLPFVVITICDWYSYDYTYTYHIRLPLVCHYIISLLSQYIIPFIDLVLNFRY